VWTGKVSVLQALVLCNNCLDCFRSLGFPCLCLVWDQEGDSKPLSSPKPRVGRTGAPAASAATRSRSTEPEGWDTLGDADRAGPHRYARQRPFFGCPFQ